MREAQIEAVNRALVPLQEEIMDFFCREIKRCHAKSVDGLRITLDPRAAVRRDGENLRIEAASLIIMDSQKSYSIDQLNRSLAEDRSRKRVRRFLNRVLKGAVDRSGWKAVDLVGLRVALVSGKALGARITLRGNTLIEGAEVRLMELAEFVRYSKRLRVPKRRQSTPRTRRIAWPRSATRSRLSLPEAGLLDWEVLPSGWWDIRWSSRRIKGETKRPSKEALERIRFVNSFDPARWYLGKSLGTRYYYVALFEGVAVAESPTWGNALYYCTTRADEWKLVFRKTKREALRAGAKRIIHRTHWRLRVGRIIRASAASLQKVG